MPPLTVLALLAGLVAFATVLGLAWRSRQGVATHTDGTVSILAADIPGVRRFASGGTLLQFSSPVCAPCATTRTVLRDVAAEHPGVAHIDLDITTRPDLASRLNIMQTPTTLVLDRSGIVRARIGGAPRPETVRTELDRLHRPHRPAETRSA